MTVSIFRPSLSTRLAKAVRALFSTGTNGYIYDPSDMASLYQDSAGTTPVTAVTNPVGFVQDIRSSLGAETVINGANPVDTTGWVPSFGSVSAVGGNFHVTATAVNGGVTQTISGFTPGVMVKVSVSISRLTGTSPIRMAVEPASEGLYYTPQITSATPATYTFIITPTGTTLAVSLYINGGDFTTVGVFNNISVKILAGNHAIQATAAARPTWQIDGSGKYYLSFLGTDDSLSSATGGGGTAGFFWCGAVKPTGGAGMLRDIIGDRSLALPAGYIVRLNSVNKLQFYAGNGTAWTSKESTATVNVGTEYMLTVWDDGINLNVQINEAAAETVARPVVAAGTAGYTIGMENGGAASFFIGNLYASVYAKNTGLTAAQRATIQAWVKQKAGL